jgi:hypothetical protein
MRGIQPVTPAASAMVVVNSRQISGDAAPHLTCG